MKTGFGQMLVLQLLVSGPGREGPRSERWEEEEEKGERGAVVFHSPHWPFEAAARPASRCLLARLAWLCDALLSVPTNAGFTKGQREEGGTLGMEGAKKPKTEENNEMRVGKHGGRRLKT